MTASAKGRFPELLISGGMRTDDVFNRTGHVLMTRWAQIGEALSGDDSNAAEEGMFNARAS